MKSLKQKLHNQEMTFGSWLTFSNAATAEIMSQAGFEWLVIDMEHAPFSVSEAAQLVRIINLAGVPSLCRLPSYDPNLIKCILDAGASGIIVPHVTTEEEAKAIVQSVYYPPRGKRGVGLARAQGYGRAFAEYCAKSQDHTVVIAMIETAAGVENVDAIAATPGIDGLLIGPYDLSGSLGCIGQLDHESMVHAKEKVLQSARKYQKGCGLHVVHPDEAGLRKAIGEGFSFLAVGVDMIYLDAAARSSAKMLSSML